MYSYSKKPAKKDSRADAALEALTKEVGNMPKARIKGTYRFALTGFVAQLTPAQAEKLINDPRVVSVIADRYVQLEEIEETVVAVQDYPIYGLDRIDQRDQLMDRAYSYTSAGTGVTAYIIDTGIRSTHSEFNGRVTLGYDFVLAYPDENDVLNSSDPGEDCHGHGTHVAGTVGGMTYGVAKDVNLVNLRVFGCTDGSPYSRIIHAVDWVTANAVKPAVVNMSLGDPVADLEVLADEAVQNSIASGVTYAIAGGILQ
nr:S8 family serine peptidase [Salinimicrobium terrae]